MLWHDTLEGSHCCGQGQRQLWQSSMQNHSCHNWTHPSCLESDDQCVYHMTPVTVVSRLQVKLVWYATALDGSCGFLKPGSLWICEIWSYYNSMWYRNHTSAIRSFCGLYFPVVTTIPLPTMWTYEHAFQKLSAYSCDSRAASHVGLVAARVVALEKMVVLALSPSPVQIWPPRLGLPISELATQVL